MLIDYENYPKIRFLSPNNMILHMGSLLLFIYIGTQITSEFFDLMLLAFVLSLIICATGWMWRNPHLTWTMTAILFSALVGGSLLIIIKYGFLLFIVFFVTMRTMTALLMGSIFHPKVFSQLRELLLRCVYQDIYVSSTDDGLQKIAQFVKDMNKTDVFSKIESMHIINYMIKKIDEEDSS